MAKKATVRQDDVFGSDHGLIHEAVITGRKAGAGRDFWSTLAHDEALFRRVVGLVSGDEVLAGGGLTLEKAAQIMGANFHSLVEAEELFGYECDRALKNAFRTVWWSADFLWEFSQTHVLVPILPLSLVQVHGARGLDFYPHQQQNPWFGGHKYAATVTPAPGWHLVRKDEVPGSTSQRPNYQFGMVKPPDFVPDTAIAAQAALLHYNQTNEKIFSDAWVRTSDATDYGGRVHVRFVPDGFVVSNWYDGARSSFGVASSRKLS